eukprot:12886400-Prorocentrum_lima.AAC.1
MVVDVVVVDAAVLPFVASFGRHLVHKNHNTELVLLPVVQSVHHSIRLTFVEHTTCQDIHW